MPEQKEKTPSTKTKLTLRDSFVVETPSSIQIKLTPPPEITEFPKVTFQIAGDAELHIDGSPNPPQCTSSTCTVLAVSGVASVMVTAHRPGPVTITASTGSTTLEATVSAVPRPDSGNDNERKPEKRAAPYLPYVAVGLSLISLAAILFIRWHTLRKLKSSTHANDLLQREVNDLSNTARRLDASLRQIRTDVDSGDSKRTDYPQSSSIPVTKQQPPVVSTPAALQAQRPAAGSPKNAKISPRPQRVEAAEASSLSTPPTPPAPMPPGEPLSPPNTDPTGDPLADYNRARAMSDLQGEDWFHRHYACRGLSCKNLDEWKLDPAARLAFEASSYGKFEALQDGTQTLVFPAFNVDYGPARGSLEGVFLYPDRSGDEVRLLSPAVVEGGGERWTLRKPGAFQHG